ncbi:MAG: metallophosphoesterase [Proteobacteria bacterium]|nr:metallophosphoesterase [Pseudomonadota bacterium]
MNSHSVRAMRIAHLSDLHLRTDLPIPRRAWLSQRVLGAINLSLRRGREYPERLVEVLWAELRQVAPDHLIVSGELTNLSLGGEFERARRALLALGLPSAAITVVPGNHDAYTWGSVRDGDFARVMADFLHTDLPSGSAGPYPLVHLRGPVAIVGLSSAVWSPPLMATGRVGATQLAAAEALLGHPEVRTRTRIVVVHHPPRSPHAHWHKRLVDGASLLAMLERTGADLLLHGHLHRSCADSLPGPAGQAIRVIGLTSSTWLSPDPARRARYNLLEVDAPGASPRVGSRRFAPALRAFVADS